MRSNCSNLISRAGEAFGRAVVEECGEDHERRYAQTHGVGDHYRFKCRAEREHIAYPRDAHAAHAEHRQYRGRERDREPSQVAGHDVVQKVKNMREHDIHHADIAGLDDLGVVVEYREQGLAEKQQYGDRRHERDKPLEHAQLERFLAAVDLARAVVLPDKGRARLRKCVDDIEGEYLDVERCARCCHDHRAETVYRRLDDDVRHRKQRALHACGQADAEDAAQDGQVDAKLFGVEADVKLGAPQLHEQDNGAYRIRDDRRYRNAADRHVEHRDEKQVQRNVQKAGYRQRNEGRFRLAHAAEDGRLEVIQQNDRQAGEVNAQVQKREREHLVRHIQHPQQGRGDQLAEQPDDYAADDGDDDRGVHRLVHGVAVAAADSVRDDDIAADADADEKVYDKPDDRAVCADGRHGDGLLGTREVADDGDVRGVKKLPEYRRCRNGQGKLRQLVPDRAV